MKKLIFILFFNINFCYATEYFGACENVINNESYKQLKDYLRSSHEVPDLCQLLDNEGYVYTTRSGSTVQFHFCKQQKTAGLQCKKERGGDYPNLEIEKRLKSHQGKQYVLFKSSLLRSGEYSEAFFVFHSELNSESGYALYRLKDVGQMHGAYSDSGELCHGFKGEEVVVADTPYYVFKENKNNLSLVFNQKLIFCQDVTSERKQQITYVWKNDRFRRLGKVN